MSEQYDPDFLANEEYADASDLNVRIQIQNRFSTNPRRWFPWLFEKIRLPEASHLLELGCGPGNLWEENRHTLPGGWKIVLADLSNGMLIDARVRLNGIQEQFASAVADAQDIPFSAERFDAVIGNGLLDHIPDRRKALGEIQRVLRPGGLFYTTAGSQTHLQEIEALVRPFYLEADYGGAPERFGLENGSIILSSWFSEIQLYRYLDRLVFTQEAPIVAYVLSEEKVKQALTGEKLAEFKRSLARELSERGAIEVTSEKGLFEARKP
jgi:ubiquinone/menaquinone biosynthesis C-methylase UbiE